MNKITTKEDLLSLIKTYDQLQGNPGCISCKECNNCINCEDLNYGYFCVDCKWGLKNIGCTRCKSCFYSVNCDNCDFCDNCVNCKNCYRCTDCKNIINGRYLINNIQFTEEEYHKILSAFNAEDRWSEQNKNWKEYKQLRKTHNHFESLCEMNLDSKVIIDVGIKEVKKNGFKLFLKYLTTFIALISLMFFTSFLLSLCMNYK